MRLLLPTPVFVLPTPNSSLPANVRIRPIAPADNAPLATLIRDILASAGLDRPGTVHSDPTTDRLYELFQRPRSRYFVAELDGQLVGGSGIYHTDGLPGDTVELARVYLVPEARGRGLGRHLIELCLAAAAEQGFRRVYLETVPELVEAVPLYEKLGFRRLAGPMGNSGHFSMEIWMLKEL